MKLNKETAEIYIPDGIAVEDAIKRTTHISIAAHQDDIEIMATHGILECFGKNDKWFTGVVSTNGAGSPRDDLYASYSDKEMQNVRSLEQKKAAFVGEYGAQVLLDYTSGEIKDQSNPDVIDDIYKIITQAKPEVVYTHNLADKHDTHVAVALRTISAIRKIPAADRPEKLLGCEVWRNLDWMNDEDKVVFDVSAHENLSNALMGVFDSQICGGKRYDLASAGRRRANATFFASHGVDEAQSIIFGIDLTPLIKDDSIDPLDFILTHIDNFKNEVINRVGKFK